METISQVGNEMCAYMFYSRGHFYVSLLICNMKISFNSNSYKIYELISQAWKINTCFRSVDYKAMLVRASKETKRPRSPHKEHMTLESFHSQQVLQLTKNGRANNGRNE